MSDEQTHKGDHRMKTNNETIHHAHALDLLDYFAAAALQGIVANPEHTHLTIPQVAKMAYTFAKTMLTEKTMRVLGDGSHTTDQQEVELDAKQSTQQCAG
jgi:hypothetical protein